MDLRSIITAEIERQGITQAQLAKQVGTFQHKISNYINGKADMRGETLGRILEALGLEVRPAKGGGNGESTRKGR